MPLDHPRFSRREFLQLLSCYLFHLGRAQGLESNNRVQAVEKFRPEEFPHLGFIRRPLIGNEARRPGGV